MLFGIMLLLYVIFSLLDIATTIIGLGVGLREANPFFLILGGHIGKFVFIALSSLIFILFRKYPFARYVMYILTIINILVVIHNFSLIRSVM